jgi:hypothetical protein
MPYIPHLSVRRRSWKATFFGTACLAALVSVAEIRPAGALIAESVAASVLIDRFGDVAGGLIDKGRDSGDFLVWRLGIQLQGVIDAWKKANSQLLNESFDKLDRSVQDFFRNIDSQVEKIRDEKNLTFEQVERLTGEWSGIISQTVIGSSDPSVQNYSPRVLVPDGGQSVSLVATGPNLAAANATVDIGSTHAVKPGAPLAHQVQFPLNRSDFAFPEDDSLTVSLTMKYQTRLFKWYNPATWFSRGRTTSDLPIVLLPKRLARYDVHTRVQVDLRESDTRIINLGKFQGRNSRIPRAVAAPDSALGWRIDLTRRSEIHLVPGGGDHGRCEGIEDSSITENGLTMFARVDNRDHWLGTRDAWVDCSISLPIYRMKSQEQDGPERSGELNWTKDETFELPPNLKSIHVNVATFDHRSRMFTGAGFDRFFELKSEGGLLIFRPRPPKDL